MRNLLIMLFIGIIFFGCKTIPPEISEFKAIPNYIEEGEKTTIKWDIKEADYVSISGIGENLPIVGARELVLEKTTTFVLKAKKKDESIENSIVVRVNPKPKKKEIPKSIPVVESKSVQISKYANGIVNAENVKPQDEPQLFINLIDNFSDKNNTILYCTVKDAYGNLIANLAPPYSYDFISNWKNLAEDYNGRSTTIENFKIEEIREKDAPAFTSSFIIDYSGSMHQDYQFIDFAIEKATKYLRPNKDDYQLIQFDHRVYNSVELTNESKNIKNKIPFAQLGGGTAFYSAAMIGINDILNSNKEKVAILFTDGADNASLENANDLVRKARQSGTKVFIIGFVRQWDTNLAYILNEIALQTGGKAYFPSTPKEIENIFQEIYRILNVYYKISYTKTDNEANKRNVNLALLFPGISKELTDKKAYYQKPDPIKEDKILAVAYFNTAKSDILEEYNVIIEKIADVLKANPEKKIKIIGHTDTKGTDIVNNRLSLQRANIVVNKLIKLGVKKSQIPSVVGMGKKQPIITNEADEEQKQLNRRVEIVFI